MIPYGKQDISQEDVNSVLNVLKSDFLTQGPMVPRFEKSLTDYSGAQFAIAMNSATSALHLACLALGVGKGDYVWTSPITFVASANCALYCGANIDFVDIDPKTYNMSLDSLKIKLQESKRSNCLPKVVIPVHLGGQSCDMEALYDLSKEYGFSIIEDASHAIGGKYKDHNVGSCFYSDITIFSFHPVKIVTTAEGGAALTNNEQLAKKLSLLRSHGITRDSAEMTHAPDGPWYYQQIDLGFNYRMTEIQAALGISQMDRLYSFVKRRREIACIYDDAFKDLPLTIQYQLDGVSSAYHLYIFRLNLNEIKKSHKDIFEELRLEGLGVNLHYIPVHTQPYYRNLGFKDGDFPNSENYYSEAISIPMYSSLTDQEVDEVIRILRKVIK